MSEPKYVLFVTYYFPPAGGPGVQRVTKFVRYLKEFGWTPIVLTPKDPKYQALDRSLEKEIPADTIVRRSSIFEPHDLYKKFVGISKETAIDVNVNERGAKSSFKQKLASFVRSTIFIPDARIGWYRSAVAEGLAIAKEYPISVVYSSSPPYTVSLIANAISKKTGIPFVAGFRDPWSGFESSTPKRWLIPRMIERRMEHGVFRDADAVDVAWQGIVQDARGKYPDLASEKFVHIPNGFDSADFPESDIHKRAIRSRGDRFVMTYSGSLYGPRNPSSVFAALRLLISRGEIDPNRVLLRFVGRFGAEIHAMMDAPDISPMIEKHDYVAHAKAVEFVSDSDALLLIVDDTPTVAEIVPGKVYEYLGSVRPMLAIAPERGAIGRLLAETAGGETVAASNIEGQAAAFKTMYDRWQRGEDIASAMKLDLISRYERREETRQLAALFDRISSAKR